MISQTLHLSLILLTIYLDRICRCSEGAEDVWFGGLDILSVIFVALSNGDIQLTLGQFVAQYEAAGMRISTSESEVMVQLQNGAHSWSGTSSSGGVYVSWDLVHE